MYLLRYRNTMEKAVNSALGTNHDPTRVVELILDNANIPQIGPFQREYHYLTVLSLINVGLHSLQGFPHLPRLKRVSGWFTLALQGASYTVCS